VPLQKERQGDGEQDGQQAAEIAGTRALVTLSRRAGQGSLQRLLLVRGQRLEQTQQLLRLRSACVRYRYRSS